MVVDTTGCPTGLSVEEQMAWAVMSKHPMLSESWTTPQHLRVAVAFVANSDFEKFEKKREILLRKWVYPDHGVRQRHCDLLHQHGFSGCKLRQRLNIPPFVSCLTGQIPHADLNLPDDLLLGFHWSVSCRPVFWKPRMFQKSNHLCLNVSLGELGKVSSQKILSS